MTPGQLDELAIELHHREAREPVTDIFAQAVVAVKLYAMSQEEAYVFLQLVDHLIDGQQALDRHEAYLAAAAELEKLEEVKAASKTESKLTGIDLFRESVGLLLEAAPYVEAADPGLTARIEEFVGPEIYRSLKLAGAKQW